MRCQWGTTWDNMQPWIAARRYKEFSILDGQLREYYGQYKSNMLALPQKTILSAMDADLVKSRQIALELYMARIVESMPEILTSQFMDVFLNMRNRISAIKKSIAQKEKKELEVAIRNGDVELDSDGMPIGIGIGRISIGHGPGMAPAPGGLTNMSALGASKADMEAEQESRENGGQYYERYSWSTASRMKAIDIGVRSHAILVTIH